MEEVTLTAEGLEKLRDEVDRLSTIGRKEIAERLEEAREFGDLVENPEYQEARKEQELLERRIAVLEERLRSARVVTAEGTSPEVSVSEPRSACAISRRGKRSTAASSARPRPIPSRTTSRASLLSGGRSSGARRATALRSKRRRDLGGTRSST